jgi:ketosteroid isomerase-like protein
MHSLAKTIGAIGLAAAAALTQGCAREPVTPAAAPAATVPAAAAAADTRAADEQAIRDLVTQTMDAAAKLDMETYLRFYAPKAALVLPGLPIQYGLSAPRENGFPEGYKIRMDTVKVEVAQSGDMGYAFGTYEQTAPDAKTRKLTDTVGKWMVVFGKQPDGSWGAIADTYNVDPPK